MGQSDSLDGIGRLPRVSWIHRFINSEDGILVWSEPGSEIMIAPVKILASPSFPFFFFIMGQEGSNLAPSNLAPRMIAISKELRLLASDTD